MKSEFRVPSQLQACHIANWGNYYVEGHIPFEVVEKLMLEAPDIDGLVMAGMPDGAPGMPGRQREDWIIYAIKDGKATVYVRFEK